MAKIKSISASEILDSRGIPTIEAKVVLEEGSEGSASVPSGAMSGSFECLELRDNDPQRYRGLGVLKAVGHVNGEIAQKLIGQEATDQENIDKLLLELDGTPNKSKLGANSILSVSQAICRAAAEGQKTPLYLYLKKIAEKFDIINPELKIPTPTFNLINGGSHGAGNLEFQEFHVIPNTVRTYSEGLEMVDNIYQSLKEVLIQHKAIHSIGDEGGFAPNLFTNLDALEIIVQAIRASGRSVGKDANLGLDVAPAFFFKEGRYVIRDRTSPMESSDFIEYLIDLQQQYPLVLLEDPLSDNDWSGWMKITQKFGDRVSIVGDDFLCTNLRRVEEAILRKACNSILIKPNQVGTISEVIKVISVCKKAGWKINVSHRSGETNDTFIADFAVGINADYVKFGAPVRGERVAKYNRLLQIEKELNERPSSNQ
jgi:enolase